MGRQDGLDLIAGTDPKTVLPSARSIIVLIEAYFREAYPHSLSAISDGVTWTTTG